MILEFYLTQNTIKHINEDASSIHGHVNTSTIFVNDSGEWLLGGFEVVTSKSTDESFIYTYGGLVPGSAKYASPEVVKSGWQILQRQPTHELDSWQFGILIYELFNGLVSNGPAASEMRSRGKIPPPLFNIQKSLCSANPRQRLSIQSMLTTPSTSNYLKNDLVKITDVIGGLSIMDDYQFSQILDNLNLSKSKFPSQYIQNVIIPELIKCLDFGKGGIRTLTVIIELSISGMDAKEFKTTVSPIIVKMYQSQDRAVRMELLQSLPNYVDLLDPKVVRDKIFSQLATGFTDTEPAIREQSVKSILPIISKLSDRQINGELLRLLAKVQNDAQPEIRANTTILLGRIASSFSPNTRSGVLVAAFGRALKDPFVTSRLSALLALAATVDYFSAQDACSKVMAALCPSLIDKDKSIRDEASKTFQVYLDKIRTAAQALDEDPSISLSRPPSAVPSQSSAAAPTNWVSWTTSLTSGISKTLSSSNSSTANTAQSTTQNNPQSITPTHTSVPSVHTPSETVSPASQFNSHSVENTSFEGGWGELQDDIDFEEDHENTSSHVPKISTFGATTSTTASSHRKPKFQPKKLSLEVAESADDDGWNEW